MAGELAQQHALTQLQGGGLSGRDWQQTNATVSQMRSNLNWWFAESRKVSDQADVMRETVKSLRKTAMESLVSAAGTGKPRTQR